MFATDFEILNINLMREFQDAPVVHAPHWQSTTAPQPMIELMNVHIDMDMEGEDLNYYRGAIRPNLPWADNHFEQERVSGQPINPGLTWREWPYALSADKHRREGEKDPQFDHSYAERYWPRFAGLTEGGILEKIPHRSLGMEGVRFPYGDLNDLVGLLAHDPLTRQAYLPVWFPEDLAAANQQKRVPCSLGYHFMMRQDKLNIFYPMRSCDFVRHFRDDVYLTIRLLLWVLQQCREIAPSAWGHVTPGIFNMHISSLHMFQSDLSYILKKNGEKK